jgi:hypothetical protein
MKQLILYLIFPLFLCQCTTISHDKTNATQLGFGARMRLDLSGDKNTNYQISLTGGASQSVFENHVMLFFQPTFILYQGGLGSKSTFKDINKFRFEIVNCFGATFGLRHQNAENTEGSFFTRPLINWSATNATALNNPYAYGLTLSSNFIWSNARNADSTRQVQRVGFASIAVPHFTMGYANDGPPFGSRFLPLGDAYDRYWSGRGFAQVDVNFKTKDKALNNHSKWQFTAEYDRFTGFLRDNYEVSNRLGLRFVPYGDEAAWNKGRWTISALNKNYNVGVAVAFYNENRSDIQNIIHQIQRSPFHGNTYKKAFAVGFLYGYQNTFLNP